MIEGSELLLNQLNHRRLIGYALNNGEVAVRVSSLSL